MSRYRAEILCIFFNTKHFRGVLYCCYFALNVFKVNLVLKLQRKEHKGNQGTAHREKRSVTNMFQLCSNEHNDCNQSFISY